LTTQHMRTLKRYTKNFVTVFDADQAGIQANLRSLPLFLEEEVWAKTVILPKGEDPDTFLRKGNVRDFESRVAEAIPLFDFFFENLMKTYDVKSMDGKVKVAEEGLALIRKVPEGLRRRFYAKALAEKLDLQEAILYEMLRSPSKDRIRAGEDLSKPSVRRSYPRPEEMTVRLMVHRPELIPKISGEGILREFESGDLKKVAEDLEDIYQKKGRLDLAEVLERFENDLKERLCAFAFEESSLEGGDVEKILKDCIQKIREKRLKKDKDELLKRIKEAEKQKGGKGLEALLLERQELARRESNLRKLRM